MVLGQKQKVKGRKQAVRRYSYSAMAGREDSDVLVRCKNPLVAAGYAGRVGWGATLDYRWNITSRQLSL